jgi:hypothetical protein
LGEIRVRYILTELNRADVLTKALVPKKHKDVWEAIIGIKEAYRLTVTQREASREFWYSMPIATSC